MNEELLATYIIKWGKTQPFECVFHDKKFLARMYSATVKETPKDKSSIWGRDAKTHDVHLYVSIPKRLRKYKECRTVVGNQIKKTFKTYCPLFGFRPQNVEVFINIA